MKDSSGQKTIRVWVVSELYFPEETSTGYFLTAIAEKLADRFDVHVVCGQPAYSKRGTRAATREQRHGVDIRRVVGTTLNKNVALFRVINMVTLGAAVFASLLWRLRRGDVVLVVTTPPLIPPLVLTACRLRGARSALIVHDVYPDVLIAAGWLSPRGILTRMLNAIFSAIYRSADRLSVLGRDMEALVADKITPSRRRDVRLIANWWEPELSPDAEAGHNFAASIGLGDRFIVQHAGNLGPVHGAEALVTAAERIAAEAPEVHFLFIGGGGRTAWLKEQLGRRALRNFSVLHGLPRREQQTFLNAADVAVMSFRPGMYGVGVPSRAYNIMAVGCPIIASMHARSEVATVVNEEQLGWVVPEDDGDALADAILAAVRDRAELERMGRRARRVAERRFTMDAAIELYRALVYELGRP